MVSVSLLHGGHTLSHGGHTELTLVTCQGNWHEKQTRILKPSLLTQAFELSTCFDLKS